MDRFKAYLLVYSLVENTQVRSKVASDNGVDSVIMTGIGDSKHARNIKFIGHSLLEAEIVIQKHFTGTFFTNNRDDLF